MTTIGKKDHVLIILAHPDDEAIRLGGTIAMCRERGIPVTYALFTLGEMGRNMGASPFATRESLKSIRRKEMEAVASLLGIQQLILLGYRDKTLEFELDDRLKEEVARLLHEIKPTRLLSFYPGHSVHPDHEAVAEAVAAAWKEIDIAVRPPFHGIAFSHDAVEKLGEPDICYDVRPYLPVKIAAIKAHKTQSFPVLSSFYHRMSEEDIESRDFLGFERLWTYRQNNR
ncbi:bacillithiol biosynthesis deacetylase BshB2 [Bacillus sp. 1P06AnD]|uniref:bacillithiol biosynthesis deacetylase BshB2 n=1 Tax=Bacillus sp. 1P06AnD TaxID=3132208 RepID=UPI0039A20A1B